MYKYHKTNKNILKISRKREKHRKIKNNSYSIFVKPTSDTIRSCSSLRRAVSASNHTTIFADFFVHHYWVKLITKSDSLFAKHVKLFS